MQLVASAFCASSSMNTSFTVLSVNSSVDVRPPCTKLGAVSSRCGHPCCLSILSAFGRKRVVVLRKKTEFGELDEPEYGTTRAFR